jgi:hypothetical protein
VKVLTGHCQLHRHSDTKGHCSTVWLNSTGAGEGSSVLTVFASGEWIRTVSTTAVSDTRRKNFRRTRYSEITITFIRSLSEVSLFKNNSPNMYFSHRISSFIL